MILVIIKDVNVYVQYVFLIVISFRNSHVNICIQSALNDIFFLLIFCLSCKTMPFCTVLLNNVIS